MKNQKTINNVSIEKLQKNSNFQMLELMDIINIVHFFWKLSSKSYQNA